jgi:lipopolysaccharide/colanic/teichoic acid biosynthesis glycosyltransferase
MSIPPTNPPAAALTRSRLTGPVVPSSPTTNRSGGRFTEVHLLDYETPRRFDPAGIPGPSLSARLVTRAFDVVVAAVALVVLAPLMAVIALAVMIESPGPILYGSLRIGHDKPLFRAWKFRSMHPQADRLLADLLAGDAAARQEYETFHKLKADPRLTPIGSFIRRTSLDELPQLFNILIGEMSVVGPRPKLPTERRTYGPALPAVLGVKPGLTGLWQISGRNELPVADRVALDLSYVQDRTLGGDLRICVITIGQLLRPGRHGAY